MSLAPTAGGFGHRPASARPGMFERLARGWRLTKASLHVLSLDKEILVLPVLSGLIMLLLAALAFGPLAWAQFTGAWQPQDWMFVAAFLGVHFVGYFVVIYFNAAVVAMADIRFRGGDPVVADGLRSSRENWRIILQWALVAATVGLVVRSVRSQLQRGGPLGALFGGLLEVAWNALIYFVVPLLVFRKLGPLAAMKESSVIIRRTWAEAAGGEVTMGLVFFALGAAGLLAVLLAAVAGGPVAAVAVLLVAVLYWVALAVVYSAAQGVLTAALYRYATTGEVPQGFDRGTLQHAVA